MVSASDKNAITSAPVAAFDDNNVTAEASVAGCNMAVAAAVAA